MEERKQSSILTTTVSVVLSTIGLSGVAVGSFVYSQYQDAFVPVAKINIAKDFKNTLNSKAFREPEYLLKEISVAEVKVRRAHKLNLNSLAQSRVPNYEFSYELGDNENLEKSLFYFLQSRVQVALNGEAEKAAEKFASYEASEANQDTVTIERKHKLLRKSASVVAAVKVQQKIKDKVIEQGFEDLTVSGLISSIKKEKNKEKALDKEYSVKNIQKKNYSVAIHKDKAKNSQKNNYERYYKALLDPDPPKLSAVDKKIEKIDHHESDNEKPYKEMAESSQSSDEKETNTQQSIQSNNVSDIQDESPLRTIYNEYSRQPAVSVPEYSVSDYVSSPIASANTQIKQESAKQSNSDIEYPMIGWINNVANPSNPNRNNIILADNIVEARHGNTSGHHASGPIINDDNNNDSHPTNISHENMFAKNDSLPGERASNLGPQLEETIVSAVNKQSDNKFHGVVVEAFTGGTRPIENARVSILGSDVYAMTDANGEFNFSDLNVDGMIPLWITKDKYFARGVELYENHEKNMVELVSEETVGKSAKSILSEQNIMSGWVFGELQSNEKEDLSGNKVDFFGTNTVRVMYIDDQGHINPTQAVTGKRGQFVALNVSPGTYFVTTVSIHDPKNVTERASHILQVNSHEAVVRKFSLGTRMTIHGVVKNASLKNSTVNHAVVQMLGSTIATSTNEKGEFELSNIYVDCSELNYLQVDQPGFYRNRVDYSCSNRSPTLEIYSSSYVDGISNEVEYGLNSNYGVILGHVSYSKSVKVQLIGADEIQLKSELRGYDFYYSKDGTLNPNRSKTSELGDFALLNAPEGLSYVQVLDKEGDALSYWPIMTSQSTVNVYRQ